MQNDKKVENEKEFQKKEDQKKDNDNKAENETPRCSRCGRPGCRPAICTTPRPPGGP